MGVWHGICYNNGVPKKIFFRVFTFLESMVRWYLMREQYYKGKQMKEYSFTYEMRIDPDKDFTAMPYVHVVGASYYYNAELQFGAFVYHTWGKDAEYLILDVDSKPA
jgi:hypothetical protein